MISDIFNFILLDKKTPKTKPKQMMSCLGIFNSSSSGFEKLISEVMMKPIHSCIMGMSQHSGE